MGKQKGKSRFQDEGVFFLKKKKKPKNQPPSLSALKEDIVGKVENHLNMKSYKTNTNPKKRKQRNLVQFFPIVD